MKKLGIILMAAAFVYSSGFFKKDKDGNYSVDTTDIEKQADAATSAANAEIGKITESAEKYSTKAIEKIKAEAAGLNVSKEEIIADLEKPMDAIKAKAAAMDPAKLTAYLNQYSNVITDAQTKAADYSRQVKELKLTEKFTRKGKDLKAQLARYTDRFNSLKEQAGMYMSTLKGFGLDPAALGIDLSAYGL